MCIRDSSYHTICHVPYTGTAVPHCCCIRRQGATPGAISRRFEPPCQKRVFATCGRTASYTTQPAPTSIKPSVHSGGLRPTKTFNNLLSRKRGGRTHLFRWRTRAACSCSGPGRGPRGESRRERRRKSSRPRDCPSPGTPVHTVRRATQKTDPQNTTYRK